MGNIKQEAWEIMKGPQKRICVFTWIDGRLVGHKMCYDVEEIRNAVKPVSGPMVWLPEDREQAAALYNNTAVEMTNNKLSKKLSEQEVEELIDG